MKINLAESNLTAEDRAKIQENLRKSSEKSPSVRIQTEGYQYFRENLTTLGTPYDVTHIPISVLEQMQRDPMIAFGLHFYRAAIMRANWYIKCEDAQVASFIDNSLKRILARFYFQYTESWNFGFKPIIKRFSLESPDWKYLDPSKSDDEIKVWDNGNVEAITWKPFVGLPAKPTVAEPHFDGSGRFNGIKYTPQAGVASFPFQTTSNPNDGKTRIIDGQHSLWVTNEKDSVNGSYWGYPRIGYAYRYWWSYWFRWAHYDRFFERKADPPFMAYYPTGGPDGDYVDLDGGEQPISMKNIALALAEGAKSGGALAMPSDTITGYDDRPTSIREWDLKELEIKGDLSHFVESFEYLDVMKLRSLLVPEQAFLEGKGGTSSRNVASEEIDIHEQGAAVLSDEIDEHINNYIIPDLVNANFPDRKVEAKKITTGFAEADTEVMKMALQILGTVDQGSLQQINLRELLERLGLPQVSHTEIRRREEKIKEEIEKQPTIEVAPVKGESAGVDKEGLYVQQGDIISLAEDSTFLSKLPDSKHFKDKDILTNTRQLRKLWKDTYKEVYEDFASYIGNTKLAEEEDDDDSIDKILSKWNFSKKKIAALLSDSRTRLKNVITKAGVIELRNAKLDPDWKPDSEAVSAWLDERGAEMVTAVTETVKGDLRSFLSEQVRNGASVEEIADGIRQHFEDFPDWKADRIARTEVTNSYNFATLAAAEQKGVKVVQALDAQAGPTDEECEARDRQFFSIPDAIKITSSEHPNNTLQWRLTKRENLSVEYVSEVPSDLPEAIASFDENTNTIYFDENISKEMGLEYLDQLGKIFENE